MLKKAQKDKAAIVKNACADLSGDDKTKCVALKKWQDKECDKETDDAKKKECEAAKATVSAAKALFATAVSIVSIAALV